VIEQQATRREALHRGLILGGAALAASLAPSALGAARAFGQADTSTAAGDAGILEGTIGIEQTAAVAYETIAKQGLLGPATSTAESFARQSRSHADLLSAELEALNDTAPAAPLPTDIPGVSQVTTKENALPFLVLLENEALAHYVEGVKKLEDPKYMQAFAEIVPNHGQHLVVLRQALGTDPMPVPLPAGTEKA
jgi:rubrerythrin